MPAGFIYSLHIIHKNAEDRLFVKKYRVKWTGVGEKKVIIQAHGWESESLSETPDVETFLFSSLGYKPNNATWTTASGEFNLN